MQSIRQIFKLQNKDVIQLNIDGLKEGQVIKNYKSLCELICAKYTTGEAKQSQLKMLQQYVQYRMEGQKFIIEKIKCYPDELMDNVSKSRYVRLIETLLVAKLVNTQALTLSYTYKQLFVLLCMASDNYTDIYKDQTYENFCNNITQIDKDIYCDFRRYSYRDNKVKIKSALESMKRRKLIDYSEEDYICIETDDGKEIHQKMTPQDKKYYLQLSREILEKLDCESIDDLKDNHLEKQFDEEIADEIQKQFHWKYKYKKVEIVNSIQDSTYLLDKTKQLLIEQARKEKVEVNKKELNAAIQNVINRTGENNYNNTVKLLEEWERGDEDWGTLAPEMPKKLFFTLFRAKKEYIPAWHILSDYFIAGDVEAAKDKAKFYPIKSDRIEDDLNFV